MNSVTVQFRPDVAGAFRILPDRPGPLFPQPLKVRLELETDLPREDLPGIYDRMMTVFKKKTRIASALERVEPETLFRGMKRTRFIEII